MQTVTRSPFTTVKTEGGLLPADLLQRIADGRNLPGLRPEEYHLYAGERLNEAINRAWNRCLGAWKGFDEQRARLSATDSGTTLTRERWLLVLFQELGFGRLPALRSGIALNDGASYPISHLWQATPIHLVTFRQALDRRSEAGTAVKRSPHSLMQELLNRSPAHQWGIIANGLQLRLLRDNASLRRAAFVEFDLEAMMRFELYAEFTLLWLVCHQSRFEPIPEQAGTGKARPPKAPEPTEDDDAETAAEEPEHATTLWLEVWSKQAVEQGTRALDALRDGVKEAIEALGSGFLTHRANETLRARLRDGTLRTDAYYHQLRRMVYRLIFLAVAEDRDLLLLPGTDALTRQRYVDHYSLHRLRELATTVRGGPHPDLYCQLRLLFGLLRKGYAPLGLPGLGSFLFSGKSTPDLDDLELANQSLLAAIRSLTLTEDGKVRRQVDYRNLDSEELGSVYESLLELHPEVNLTAATFALNQGAGAERKTTGSHYTPTPLVESLVDTALEPVVADRLAKAEEEWRASGNRSVEARRDLQERAILSIKVLDAATGSGHMLIGGGRRLARHLARIRSGEDEPSPEALRNAMRDVVRHCLYGVDLNDMAVELCKVALWMESMEPGKPLSFLDAHIQCGNSLIGVVPGMDISEIPDDAFQPVTGDDKATAAGLRRRNKKERDGQMALLLGDAAIAGSTERHAGKRAQMVATIEDLAEDGVEQVADKERSYAEYLESTEYKWARWEADTWTAAFFWPIPAGDAGRMAAPTQEVLRVVQTGKLKQHEALLKEVRRIAKQHRFFHWALQFPDVFQRENSGFDVVLMNPPWDQVQFDAREFFAFLAPDIAQAGTTAMRNRLIDKLRTDAPALFKQYSTAYASVDHQKDYVHASGRYPLTNYGRLNLAPLFAEFSRSIVSPVGRVGLIVPTGIATDSFNQYFFRSLMDNHVLVSLWSFENEEQIFPSIHHATKFCLLTLAGGNQMSADFLFFARHPDDIKDETRHFSLSSAEIALLNPNTRTCPTFRCQRDAELARAIYSRVPVLVRDGTPEVNPWNLKLQLMFMMNTDSGLFHEASYLESTGFTLVNNRYVNRTADMLPLYEGKMIHQFDHRFGSYVGQTKAQANQGKLPELNDSQHADPDQLAIPRFWVSRADADSRLDDYEREWFIAFRDITSAVVLRTSIFCVVPRVAAGNKVPLVLLRDASGYDALVVVSCANSFVFDFVARFSVGGTNLNFYILKQLPVVSPSEVTKHCPWSSTHETRAWIALRALELTYTAWDLQPFARDCGYDGPPFRWDEARRLLLRCELDAAYFHLYGIARDDVDYIMETFPIVKRKDVAKHGEYRTRRVILEIYDAMAEAMRSGEPYPTRLDPPPADPRVAHPGR